MALRIYENVSRPGLRRFRSGTVMGPPPYKGNNAYTYVYNTYDSEVDPTEAGRHGADTNHRNALYGRFVERCRGDTSQLLTAAVEWNSSLDMVTKRAIQLRRAYSALRRWDLPQVVKHLGMSETSISPQGKKRIKRARRLQRPTEAWLEYWMGWAPAYSDIYNAIDNLQKPTPNQHINVGVSRRYTYLNKQERSWMLDVVETTTELNLGAYGNARVTNHNLWIANQLGLINPAQTAWEVVPFSFVADWITNVGQVLGSLTDFAGLTITDSGVASLKNVSSVHLGWIDSGGQRNFYSGKGNFTEKTRAPGRVSPPSLSLRLPSLSLSRAATSVSLLTEIFLLKK